MTKNTPARYQLTLSQLAEFDDLLTDALVDRVHYWTTIRKIRHAYLPNRGVKTDAVCKIIVEELVKNKSVANGLQRFLELNGIKGYLNKIGKDENLKNDFYKHARRYLSIYLPEAGFEVSSTNRYNLSRPEACVIARKSFQRGATLKYLTGAMVKMTEEEENEYCGAQSDFSIIYSSRVAAMSLLLGPARFVNHDCDPNAKFITTNKDHIQLLVEKDIAVGEEITVSYGDGYFGPDNRECLCRSCELLERNGWAREKPAQETVLAPPLEETAEEMMSTRSRSKRKSMDMPLPPPEKRAKTNGNGGELFTPPESDRATSEDVAAAAPVAPETRSFFDSPSAAADTGMETPVSDGIATPAPQAISTKSFANHTTPARAAVPPRLRDVDSTDATDIAETLLALSRSPVQKSRPMSLPPASRPQSSSLPAHMNTPETRPPLYNSNSAPPHALPLARHAPIDSTATPDPQTGKRPTPVPESQGDEGSDLSDISDSEFHRLDNSVRSLGNGTTTKSEHKSQKKLSSKPAARKTALAPPPVYYEPPAKKRFPGDYLICDSESVECTCADCKEKFFHDDRWYLPRSCKRCERHSRIYGLVWPKTVKRKNDDEEQIQDHRTIQRYVTMSEHRKQQKILERQRSSGSPADVPIKREATPTGNGSGRSKRKNTH